MEPAVAREGADDAAKTVDFARDVRPVFVRRCHKCHGPQQQKGDFRLDRREALLRGGESGEPAIVPGKSGESHLIQLVSGENATLVMPPEGERLSPAEVAVLRAWIDQGAKWSAHDGTRAANTAGTVPTTDHWSFQPLTRIAPPAVDDPWAAGPIDAFVFAKLQANGLTPSQPANRVSLIRRLYLDLLGLPPAPDEIDEFVGDARLDAYERLVDRVLASPHYGERWARHWLDVVRFADTHGFEMNRERPNSYHYRDYVIRTFNEDKPYDSFVKEQLAGDALGTDEATGFLVGGPWDQVKSPDIGLTLMQRQDELADMVNTTSTTFLGLTLGCAKCHNHKFDPLLQTDFYAMQAVFAGVEHGERPLSGAKFDGRQSELAAIERRLAAIQARLAEAGVRPPVNARENFEQFAPVRARFVRFTIAATNDGAEPCLDELEIFAVRSDSSAARNVALATNGAKVQSSGDYAGNPKHKLEHLHDGRFGNERSWISNTRGAGWVRIELPETTHIDRIVWGRDRNEQYKDRLPTQYTIEVAAEPGQWQTVADSTQRLPADVAATDAASLQEASVSAEKAEQLAPLLAEIARLQEQRQQLAAPPTAYAGRFIAPPVTHRLFRGDPLAKREEVAPAALAVLQTQLGPLPLQTQAEESQRRIALAEWIANDKNPLTARVIVNRIWQYHFGTGLVATPSDFGHMGSAPSHPELLDWLAGEFIRSGWSIKAMHRLIVTSNTYQQASVPNEQGLAVDADSRLLWRFPPRRLEAEIIRDALLHVSGTLEQRMYGPGFNVFKPNDNYVRVYLPKDAWGPAEWRRMIYVLKVRMEQDAVFGAFDCPDAGQAAPRRSQSTTAIQALNLFNSEFVVQQASLLADRLRCESGNEAAGQIDLAFRLTLGRPPDERERAAAAALVAEHGLAALCRALFNANEFLFVP
jgi:hypothetical protein